MAMPSAEFATTHWSLVLAAGDRDAPQAEEALASLCASYWYPLYAYVRRQGSPPEQAEDLTQEFFARLLEKQFLRDVHPEKGKFRAYLMACFRHFLANERDRPRAQKRGGGKTVLSLNFPDAETRYRLEPAHELTPERLYERQWALALLEQVLNRLRDEAVSTGHGKLFDALKIFLTGETPSVSYEQVAASLGLSVGAVKVAVHRQRHRYRELLREEIGRIVGDASEIDEEIQALFIALG
ncbi:MAG TPA: sigma-70 family RNA polymerase sigma factor [Gemmataceae bacterium]|nr:sigma-70 family RNA polymerase sigma factor [Gemmataceae bacterium]